MSMDALSRTSPVLSNLNDARTLTPPAQQSISPLTSAAYTSIMMHNDMITQLVYRTSDNVSIDKALQEEAQSASLTTEQIFKNTFSRLGLGNNVDPKLFDTIREYFLLITDDITKVFAKHTDLKFLTHIPKFKSHPVITIIHDPDNTDHPSFNINLGITHLVNPEAKIEIPFNASVTRLVKYNASEQCYVVNPYTFSWPDRKIMAEIFRAEKRLLFAIDAASQTAESVSAAVKKSALGKYAYALQYEIPVVKTKIDPSDAEYPLLEFKISTTYLTHPDKTKNKIPLIADITRYARYDARRKTYVLDPLITVDGIDCDPLARIINTKELHPATETLLLSRHTGFQIAQNIETKIRNTRELKKLEELEEVLSNVKESCIDYQALIEVMPDRHRYLCDRLHTTIRLVRTTSQSSVSDPQYADSVRYGARRTSATQNSHATHSDSYFNGFHRLVNYAIDHCAHFFVSLFSWHAQAQPNSQSTSYSALSSPQRDAAPAHLDAATTLATPQKSTSTKHSIFALTWLQSLFGRSTSKTPTQNGSDPTKPSL